MRYYFHLVRGKETILDEEGVESPTLEEAQEAALETIEELSEDEGLRAGGWALVAVDATGQVAFRIDLASVIL